MPRRKRQPTYHKPHTPLRGQIVIRHTEFRDPIDVDLLVQAIIMIAEQQLRQEQAQESREAQPSADSMIDDLSPEQSDQLR